MVVVFVVVSSVVVVLHAGSVFARLPAFLQLFECRAVLQLVLVYRPVSGAPQLCSDAAVGHCCFEYVRNYVCVHYKQFFGAQRRGLLASVLQALACRDASTKKLAYQ